MFINSKRRNSLILWSALIASLSRPATAGWWIFGKSSGKPQIVRIFVGDVEVGRGEAKTDLYLNNLREGRLDVKAFFRLATAKSIVAQAQVSLDDGASWDEKVELANDSFLYSFQPKPEQSYRLRVKILDTKGQENDASDIAQIVFVYHAVSGERKAEDALRELARRYSNRDYGGFADLIAEDYRGDPGALMDAVARDFKTFSSINLGVILTRTLINDGNAKIDFRYDETVVRSTDSSTSKSSGQASYTLKLEDNVYKLYIMPPPAIFGVTAPPSDNPNITTGGTGSNLPQRQGYANMSNPFDFKLGQNSSPGDITYDGFSHTIGAPSPGGIQSMGNVPLNSVSQAPASGYSSFVASSVGTTYAVKTTKSTYALFQITSISGSGFSETIYFNYLYQPNGTRIFQ